jgi:NADPH-dependent curcumin reductase CurA
MSNPGPVNRRIVLAARPTAAATLECFRLERAPIPAVAGGQILLKTLWLSLDPYMRGRMSDAPSYAAPVALGAVMTAGVVARVEQSQHPGFAVGDLVVATSGWQEYAVSDGTGVMRLPPTEHPSYALGVLGMPGFTAYMGLLDIGRPAPGETVAVAAATGAVGSVVGQIAKLKGCRVVGIAGGSEKCAFAVQELGFDACIDHRSPEFPNALRNACPQGIDVYFENVGGKVFEAVLPLLNTHARVPVCGLISQYQAGGKADQSDAKPASSVLCSTLMRSILIKRLTMRGFIIFDDYGDRFTEFLTQMTVWLREGRIKYREDVVPGLESAPRAFLGLLEGRNFGKLIVKVAS